MDDHPSDKANSTILVCDKCGQPVHPANDATMFELYLTGSPFLVFAQPRHLLPVTEGVACPGSPSRAQYLEGQPRDARGQYPYHPEREEPYRNAYRQLRAGADPDAADPDPDDWDTIPGRPTGVEIRQIDLRD